MCTISFRSLRICVCSKIVRVASSMKLEVRIKILESRKSVLDVLKILRLITLVHALKQSAVSRTSNECSLANFSVCCTHLKEQLFGLLFQILIFISFNSTYHRIKAIKTNIMKVIFCFSFHFKYHSVYIKRETFNYRLKFSSHSQTIGVSFSNVPTGELPE